jgi:hypothetical protein
VSGSNGGCSTGQSTDAPQGCQLPIGLLSVLMRNSKCKWQYIEFMEFMCAASTHDLQQLREKKLQKAPDLRKPDAQAVGRFCGPKSWHPQIRSC